MLMRVPVCLGLKMKVLSTHRAGLSTNILPKRNERDLDELPDDVRAAMMFTLTEMIDEGLATALRPSEAAARPLPAFPGSRGKAHLGPFFSL